jgi:hypothetical protein
VAGTAAGIAAAVDIEAEHTAVAHTVVVVGHTAVAVVAEDIVVDRTEIVVDRMQVAHTAVAVAANNPVDYKVSDRAAAVVCIAQSA